MWLRLVTATFDIDLALGIAVLQHFIWQVKCKLLERPVCHHLMPVIFSEVQGCGKTTLLKRFLSPLEELASATALLSDLADPRSGEILSFPVVAIDDVERLDPRRSPVLKSLMTTPELSRRQLGTSKANRLSQRATLIGTANEPVSVLISDPTGHTALRRAAIQKRRRRQGGNPEVWRVVDETDYGLLWRSVNGFGPSPILPHLTALAAAQAVSAPVDRLRECLVGRPALRGHPEHHRAGRRARGWATVVGLQVVGRVDHPQPVQPPDGGAHGRPGGALRGQGPVERGNVYLFKSPRCREPCHRYASGVTATRHASSARSASSTRGS